MHLPLQRSAPPAHPTAVLTPIPAPQAPLGAPRGGRHDWGAVAAALLAALVVAGAALGPGGSVADADGVAPPSVVQHDRP